MRLNPVPLLQRGFPILGWLPKYRSELIVSDFVGGITIGLTLIPQSIAYAALAGLTPEIGLYSALCGGFIYAIFGTVPELNIAPTALLSLLTFHYTFQKSFPPIPGAILLCFLAGCVELICGVLHLGFLVEFISTPVVAGFTSAGALVIASAQVKNMLGLSFVAESFKDIWINVFRHLDEIEIWDTALSLICCVALLGLKQAKVFGIAPFNSEENGPQKYSKLKKIIWFISVARNALVVIVCSVVAYFLQEYSTVPFALTSNVPSGLPDFAPPSFNIESANKTLYFKDVVFEMGSGIFVVPFVAILGNVAISKAFAHGKVVDATQEMIAVGICNIISSFFGSMPINASFSRAAVSNASGTKTPFSGIYTGIMVILALTFLTPYFSYMPKATLSSVIICAVIYMVEVTLAKMIWKINRMDLIPLLATFFACLVLGMEIGILVGIVSDVLLILYYTARPKILIDTVSVDRCVSYIKITPSTSLHFPSAEYIRERIMKYDIEYGNESRVIVIDCSRVNKTDFTAAKCLGALVTDLHTAGKVVVFLKPKPSFAKMLTKTSGKKCCFANAEDAVVDIIRGQNHQQDVKYSQVHLSNGSLQSKNSLDG